MNMGPNPLSRRALLTTVGLSSIAGCTTTRLQNVGKEATETTEASNRTTNSGSAGWPQVGRTAAHTGYNAAVSIDDEPHLAWEQSVQGSLTTPTVADDTVYLTRAVTNEEEAAQATLEAYALDTGDRQWSLSLGFDFQYNAPLSNHRPIIHNRRVYVTTRDSLVALSIDDHERMWEVSFDGFLNDPPTATGDGLYAAGSGRLVHLDHEGNERWSTAIDTRTRPRLVAVMGDTVYASGRANLKALDAASGDVRWEYTPDEGGVGHTAVVSDGSVVVTSFYGFEAISTDGTRRWRAPGFDREAPHRAVVGQGTVFVAGIEGSVAALDLTSGKRRWQTSIGDGEWTQETAPVLVDGALCVPQADGEETSVHALDPSLGEKQWRFSAPGARIRGPIPAAGHLVVATQSQHVNGLPNPNSNSTAEPPEIVGTLRAYAV